MATAKVEVEHDPVGEFVCESPWRDVVLSPAAVRMLGLPAELTITELAATHPAGPGLGSFDRAITEAARTGRPVVMTYETRCATDRIGGSFVAVVHRESGPDEMPARVRGYLRDITADIRGGTGSSDGSILQLVRCGPAVVVVASGALDMSNRAVFDRLLRQAIEVGDREIYLDLSRLRFCEAHAVALMVDAAAGLSPGRRLVLLSPSTLLRRVLGLASRDDAAADAIEVRDVLDG